MDFQAIQNDVIAKLQESATPAYWGLTEIKANINRGYREVYKRTSFVDKISAALVIAGNYYPFPTDMLLPKALLYGAIKLDQTHSDYLDGIDAGWRATAGTPTNWVIDEGKIRLYPLPAAPSAVTLRYVASPAALVNNADTPVFPVDYHDALTYFALAECFSREGDGQDLAKAQQWLGMFQRLIAEFIESLNNWKLASLGQTGNDFKGLIYQVKAKLGESPVPMKFTIEEIKSAINRAYRELYKQTGYITKFSAALTISGSGYPLPTDFLLPKAVYYIGSKIDQTTTDHLDAINPAWQSTAGVATKWFFHNGQIRLYPLPPAPGAVTIRYVAAPTALVAAADTVVFPAEYKDAILYHALGECFNREGEGQNTQKAQAWFSQFAKMVQDFTQGMNQWNLVSQGQTGTDFQSLIFRVKSKLDEAPTPVKFAVEEIKAAINRGVYEFARQTEFKTTTATLAPSGNGFVIPSDMLAPKALLVNDSKIDQTTEEYLDGLSATWTTETGTPVKWYFSGNLIYLYPRSTAVVTVKLRYITKPTLLSNPTDTPDTRLEYLDAIWQWACFELLGRKQDPANAQSIQIYKSMFDGLVKDFKDATETNLLAGFGETDSSLGGLLYRTLRELKKFGGKKVFQLDEIKNSINAGYREFVKLTQCRTKLDYLVPNGDGTFVIPTDLLLPKAVYYNSLPLDQSKETSLDDLIAGTGRKVGVIGDDTYNGIDWRATNNDQVLYWLISEGKIRLYPIPSIDYAVFSSTQENGSLAAGGTIITMANRIDMDESKILLTLGATVQQTFDYDIRNPLKIVVLSAVPAITPWSTKTCASSEQGTIAVGGTTINLAGNVNYPDMVEFYLGGVLQTYLTDYTFPLPNQIELNAAVGGGTPWKLALFYSSSVKMLYIPKPDILTAKTDSPSMIPEAFREALVYFAVQEILSFDPKADRIVTARRQQFEDMTREYVSQFSAPIIKSPAMPFVV